MKNPLITKKVVIISCLLICLFSALVFASDPGSSSDPLISLSYFEDKIENLQETLLDALSSSLNDKYDELEKKINKKIDETKDDKTSKANSFELITLAQGETIICDAGTEIIVRSGKSVVVTSETSSGGISDITLGTDLVNGTEIVNNHLLIIPKADGRGIKATITGAIMIKGNYTRENN